VQRASVDTFGIEVAPDRSVTALSVDERQTRVAGRPEASVDERL
jgi:hypothetical protein